MGGGGGWGGGRGVKVTLEKVMLPLVASKICCYASWGYWRHVFLMFRRQRAVVSLFATRVAISTQAQAAKPPRSGSCRFPTRTSSSSSSPRGPPGWNLVFEVFQTDKPCKKHRGAKLKNKPSSLKILDLLPCQNLPPGHKSPLQPRRDRLCQQLGGETGVQAVRF